MTTINRNTKLVLGIDPGLNNTGWAVVRCQNNTFEYLGSGTISNSGTDTPDKLKVIYEALLQVIRAHRPIECAVEETFVNKNPYISLKLGYAKGVALLAACQEGLAIAEYAPALVKKALTNNGNAPKDQVAGMIRCLMPRHQAKSDHETDALAIAVCHINTLPVKQFT